MNICTYSREIKHNHLMSVAQRAAEIKRKPSTVLPGYFLNIPNQFSGEAGYKINDNYGLLRIYITHKLLQKMHGKWFD